MSVRSPRIWNREEFRRLADSGVLATDERLELLDGVIVTKMTQNAPHVTCTLLVSEWLRSVLPTGWSVRTQAPVALSERSQPEPDVAVVRGGIRDYVLDHPSPSDIVLLVEVADSSVREDRRSKTSLYATAGIEEFWIVDINARRVIVHQGPESGEYRLMRILHQGESIHPPFAEGSMVSVRDLLP